MEAGTGDPRARLAVAACLVAMAGAVVLGLGVAARHAQAIAAATAGGEQSLAVEPRAFAATLSVAGTVVPGDAIDVTAPFDGVVRSVGFVYGAPVAEGQALVELDTREIAQRRNEGEAEYLKASQAAADMKSWNASPEVSQARRAEATAAFDLADTRRKTVGTKALLDRGLVARDEYDTLVQQQRGQEMSLAAARQDLGVAVARGRGANRRVVDIELQNARARLADLDVQAGGAVVRAPAAGVITHPASEKIDASSPMLHAGQTLTRGQLIGAVARPGGLSVAFQLGESDANRVRPGQRVEVTGPGFSGQILGGIVASVAREATPGSASNGPAATFAGVARLDPLGPGPAGAIRIGMTANVVVHVYDNPAALVVPPAAIQGAAPNAFVTVKDPRTGKTRPVAVRIGRVAPDGVEVLSGLRPGDVVAWKASSTAGADDSDSE